MTLNKPVDESDKDGGQIKLPALCRKIINFLLRFDFTKFFIAGLIPILVFVVTAHTNWKFLLDLGFIKEFRGRPQKTLVCVGIYYFVIGIIGILTKIKLVKEKAKEAFEHKKLLIQPKWLSTREEFVPCESEEKKHTHIDSVHELEKAKMSGIEGGAGFVAIIILLFTLVAVLFTTLFYFMIGTTFNLVGKDDGFLFVNNEGFTAAISLLVVLVAAAVVPVYTDLGKTISEQLNFFEEEISNISRNLLFIGQRMDPVWDHYQNITNRVVPEWFLAIDEELEENDSRSFVNDLKASLRIDKVFEQATKKTGMEIEPFHENTFLALGQEFARLEPSGIFLHDKKKIVEHVETKKLGDDAKIFIQLRLKRLIDETAEVLPLENDSLKKEIKNRRRYLAYQAIKFSDSVSIKKIENYFPPSEWEVSLLVGDEKPSKTLDSLYKYFGNSFQSFLGHHMDAVKQLAEDGDRSLSGLCLKSDISADIFLDDYHLFKHLRVENNGYEDGDPVWSQNRAREIYYAIFFFASQDPKSERSKTVRAFEEPNQKVKTNKGQVFFEDLFSYICTSQKVKEYICTSQKVKERHLELETAQEQLLLDLTYERSALHNWIRASQAVTRRRIWIELSNELSNKVETRKAPPSLWGLPIVPTRDRRLHDLMRHAGVPIIDKKRLRLLTLGNIVEEAGRDKTKGHIEQILFDENWVTVTRAKIIEAEKRSVKYNKFIEALRPTNEQIKQLKAEKTVWLEPKPLRTKPSETAIIFWRYFLEQVDGEIFEPNGDDSTMVHEKMIKKLDTDWVDGWVAEQLKAESKDTYEARELIRKLKFLDPMRDILWHALTNKITKENLIRETLKIYTQKFVDSQKEQSKEFITVSSSWLLLFKRSLNLKDRPGIGRKEDILKFEMDKSLKIKQTFTDDKVFAFTDDDLFDHTLKVATIKFAEENNPFWGSVKEQYLDRIRGSIEKKLPDKKIQKIYREFRVNDKTYGWRSDVNTWNIALESRHTPSDFASDNADLLGVGTNWLKYSLQQCDKLGFTSVNRTYIVSAVKFWEKEIDWIREEQKSDYKFEKPDGGSTTWTQYGNKWMLTAHSFVVNEKNYIWRVATNGNWNIALESMHTPSDTAIHDREVLGKVRNWLEYSLQICANYGFTVVDDNYLKEAVAIWDNEIIWNDYGQNNDVNVMIDKKDRTSATWTKEKGGWVLGR